MHLFFYSDDQSLCERITDSELRELVIKHDQQIVDQLFAPEIPEKIMKIFQKASVRLKAFDHNYAVSYRSGTYLLVELNTEAFPTFWDELANELPPGHRLDSTFYLAKVFEMAWATSFQNSIMQ